MKLIIIYIYKYLLKFIYFFLKLFPTGNKITFLSRQSNSINIDFKLIKEEIEKKDKTIKMIFICERMDKGLKSAFKYALSIFRQMYHIATSKMVILDSYSIPVSVLNHKKSLFVLQIWHSIGKIKKSGYQTLDTPSGRSRKVAKALCMHQNYDAIVAGSKAFNKFYEEGFNVKEDILLNYGLPRIDYLLNREKSLKEEIYESYPELKDKTVIYYVPTFREYKVEGYKDLIDKFTKDDFILIIREHPNQKYNINNDKVYRFDEFKSQELLTIADYVITDYSSITLEAAILDKKVLFYVYDHDKYMKNNGLNIDFYKILPTCSSENINDLYDIIKSNKYDNKNYQRFRKEYLPDELGHSTRKITEFILRKLK